MAMTPLDPSQDPSQFGAALTPEGIHPGGVGSASDLALQAFIKANPDKFSNPEQYHDSAWFPIFAALVTAGIAGPAAYDFATSGGVASGLTGAASTAGADTGAAFDAAGNFIGPSTVTGVGTNAGLNSAATTGLSGTDLLKYGLPTVGNIVGGLIQANATSNASDAQRQYLEEALAYQEKLDAYNQQTTAAKYAYGTNLESSRYGDYSANIAPYVATGTSANARMASLLGLPSSPPPAIQRPTAPPPPPQTPFPASPMGTGATPPPTNTNGPTVTLQGPDGSQQSFQSTSPLVAQYLARPGYTQVQANG